MEVGCRNVECCCRSRPDLSREDEHCAREAKKQLPKGTDMWSPGPEWYLPCLIPRTAGKGDKVEQP